MKILKNFFMICLSLILTIAVVSIMIINQVSSTILKKDYILAKLEETDYYHKIYEYVESNFEKYIYQSGLDESVIENVITEEQVKQDTQKILANLYDHAQETIETEEMKQKLETNIQTYLTTNHVTADQEAIDAFVQTVCNEYTNSISHYKYEEKINTAYQQVLEYVAKAKKIVYIAIIVSVLALLLINLKQIHYFFTYTGIASLATGIFLTFLQWYISAKVDIKNILILNEAISDALKSIVYQILNAFMKEGIYFLVAGILCIILTNFICAVNKKEKYKFYEGRNDNKNGRN